MSRKLLRSVAAGTAAVILTMGVGTTAHAAEDGFGDGRNWCRVFRVWC